MWTDVTNLIQRLESRTAFSYSPVLGYLCSCPSNLGTSMKVSFRLEIPNIINEGELEHLLRGNPIGFKVIESRLVEVWNT